jgi:hypothetical protein
VNMLDAIEGAYQQMTRAGRFIQSVGDGWMVWSRKNTVLDEMLALRGWLAHWPIR